MIDDDSCIIDIYLVASYLIQEINKATVIKLCLCEEKKYLPLFEYSLTMFTTNCQTRKFQSN